ncbi:outer membrane beta-barrel protein [bacterium]|nr:outer membrane beta-barrel protein [bacterium]
MKRRLFALTLVLMASAANAQLDFGLRAGLNLTDLNFKEFGDSQTWEDIANGDRAVGYHFGVYADINLVFLELQPELLYTRLNGSVEATDANTGQKTTEDIGINRIDIPLLVLLKPGPIRLGGGPVYSVLMGSTSDLLENGLANGTWAGQLVAGVEFWKISADLRYEFSWSDAADYFEVSGETISVNSRPDAWVLALGFELF